MSTGAGGGMSTGPGGGLSTGPGGGLSTGPGGGLSTGPGGGLSTGPGGGLSTGPGVGYRSNTPPMHEFIPILRRNGYTAAADLLAPSTTTRSLKIQTRSLSQEPASIWAGMSARSSTCPVVSAVPKAEPEGSTPVCTTRSAGEAASAVRRADVDQRRRARWQARNRARSRPPHRGMPWGVACQPAHRGPSGQRRA